MPSQPSQDLEARFSVFLNPIRDLTKNWEVDIAKYLEDYLVELSEIQITFDGGVTVMNFAEAAMLIQGSATVYSKKVEFLWQMVLQMLDLLSSKKNLDADDEGSHKTGGTGRSNKNSPILNFERVNKMLIGKNIDLKVEDEVDKKSEFKFLPAVPLHLVEKESEKSTMPVTLYLKNKEPFGNKDDYRINRSYLTPSGLLCLDLPHEFLQQNFGQNLASDEANESLAGFFKNASILDEPVAPNEANEEAVPNVDMAEDDVDHGGGIENNEEVENMEVDAPVDLDPRDLPAENPVLNNEGIEASEGVVEPLVEYPNAADGVEGVEESVVTLNGRYGLRKKAVKEKIADVIKLTDPLKPLDPHIETPARRPVRAGRLRKPLPCSCHKEMHKNSRTRSKALKEVDNLGAKTISVEEFITKDLARLIANNNNNNSDPKLVNAKLIQELTNENKKKQEKVKKDKLKRDLPCENNELGDEEGAEQAGMNAVEGADIDDFDADNDAVPNIDFENIGDAGDNFDLPDPHQNNNIETPFGVIRIGGDDEESDGNSNRTLNDSMLYEPGSEYEALVQKWVSEYIANAQEHVISSDLVRRVNRWRKIITPKLVEEEDRKAFDIHEYGSKILSHFPSDSDGGQVPFRQVAEHEDHREVSRIFLSCLMLANTYNVHLSNTIEGPLQMDCLQLKLLSRVRHHQELDEAASSRQQARPQTVSPQSNPSDKRSSPVNRNRKKRRRKTVVNASSGGDSGNDSEGYSDDLYVPNKGPSSGSGSSGSDNINSNRQQRRTSSKSFSSKKLKTLSENR